jgi:type VI secretion system protein ImpL
MPPIFGKILKYFLVLTAFFLLLLLVFGIVLVLEWPWWVGFFVLVGLAGGWAGLLLIQKIWVHRREKRFVQQVIEQDEEHLRSLAGEDQQRSKELQEHWKEAIAALKKSHLKKIGNPLYVLPWYLVIGESGSGKTTAIESARLSSPFAEVSRTSGISGTRNCDWWFLKNAIFIDTAGRYAIPVDERRDKEEWQKFLTLLARYRKKEPLNGLVVTIAADVLTSAAAEALEEKGRSIRRRMDELMRVIGAKFPVYVLVTKCDLIQGMTRFCDHLPEPSLNQAVGRIKRDLEATPGSFLGKLIDGVSERFRNLRLVFFLHPTPRQHSVAASHLVDPGLLLFPEEFEQVQNGLTTFLQAAFQENPYQETPLLRGVFFSSGRQEGTPYSHFLKDLGLIEQQEMLPGTNKGLFLHDFFSKILPLDRGLLAPTQRTLAWSRVSKNLAILCWLAFMVALCGLLSFSFVKNLKILRDISHEFAKPPLLQGELLGDVIVMDRFRQAIRKVENQNSNWWIPRFGLTESQRLERHLKTKYCRQFTDGFLAPFDGRMAKRMSHFSKLTGEEEMGRYVAHLVRRINLLKAMSAGGRFDTLQRLPKPSFESVLRSLDENIIPEVGQRLEQLYVYFLIWRKDAGSFHQELTSLANWLKHLLTLEGIQLNWLASWANLYLSDAGIEIGDFWNTTTPVGADPRIAPAFTLSGKDHIESLLKEIESALADPIVIAAKTLEFQRWYREAYLESWRAFGIAFEKGTGYLRGKADWQQAAAKMAGDDGAYFKVLAKMAVELQPFAGDGTLPAWGDLLYRIKAIRLEAKHLETVSDSGMLAKARKKGHKLIGTLDKKTGVSAEDPLEARIMAAKAFRDYQMALGQIGPALSSRNAAFQMAVAVFGGDPVNDESPVFAARKALDQLQPILPETSVADYMPWQLLNGPLTFLWRYVCNETACHLQDAWEKEVLVEVQDVADHRTREQMLLGNTGLVRQFAQGTAAPFMTRNIGRGYSATQALGQTLPFDDSFFSFLARSAVASVPIQESYTVSISAEPTDVNPEAHLHPHLTVLELRCIDDNQILVNRNFPVHTVFGWSPRNCEDVLLKIEVGDLVLVRRYSAFPIFLREFAKGECTFTPRDFPNEQQDLKRMGISSIRVKYRFTGSQAVIRGLEAAPDLLPRKIVACWEQ